MLGKLAGNPSVEVREIDDDDIMIYVDEQAILRIYPSHKSAEFLLAEGEWGDYGGPSEGDETLIGQSGELEGALKDIYQHVPELDALRQFMCDRNYFITW